jgi:hypothetical protein
MAKRGSFLDYVKAAFLWHWNLLAFGAGTGLALLVGPPDVVFPLVAAVEIAYLGLLSTNVRFQKAIDVRNVTSETGPSNSELMERIRAAVKPEAWERFEALRQRCVRLNRLAQQLRGVQTSDVSPVSDMQTESLERLLWIFVKLLYSQNAIQQFLRGTDRRELVQNISSTEQELSGAKEKQRGENLIRSIEDKLETLRQRLANYDRVDENREFLEVEIERIEQKVNAISELAINARDASDITAQVDGIAAGISATEEAMRGLEVAPQVFEYEKAPQLLREIN